MLDPSRCDPRSIGWVAAGSCDILSAIVRPTTYCVRLMDYLRLYRGRSCDKVVCYPQLIPSLCCGTSIVDIKDVEAGESDDETSLLRF